jgi:hypothetical protein
MAKHALGQSLEDTIGYLGSLRSTAMAWDRVLIDLIFLGNCFHLFPLIGIRLPSLRERLAYVFVLPGLSEYSRGFWRIELTLRYHCGGS